MMLGEYQSRTDLAEGLAETVAKELGEALETRGSATLAVPGGTTPGPFLEALSKADLDWSRVHVMLTDERFVPESSERSNTALLRRTLMQNNAAAATLIPFYQQAETPEEVLDDITLGVAKALPLDVCVLGMGADMHTASLFPGADMLEAALSDAAPPVLPMRADGAPEPRLTLTAPILKAARHIHILITGAEKKSALDVAQHEGSVAAAPVRAVLPQATVHYAE
ncbi:6-phosphogluconolactonase [Paracoccaceae bacterium GXU_MW_L88]